MKPKNPYKDCEQYSRMQGWDEGYEACANQPISEQEGWIDFNSQHPTEDEYYLVETPDFYKNCEFIVAEWNNRAECFYEEAFDNPIEVRKYKLIYTT